MIYNCMYVMIGGAIGALLRYLASRLLSEITVMHMPVATLIINILGCFILGLLYGYAEHNSNIPTPLLTMLTVGVCGAFTTFSTFSGETIRMIDQGLVLQAVLYVGLSVVVGLCLFALGHALPK